MKLKLFTTLCSAFFAAGLFSQTPVLTYHADNFRTGWYQNESILTPSNVSSSKFGKLFQLAADGKVDAQPLYVPRLSIGGKTHNVVFVATEHDSVYAYDADTAGSPLWKVSMLKSGETSSDDRGCSQVTPEIGVTATPAIDLRWGPHGTMYVVAMSKDSNGNYHQRLHALDITTGQEQFGGPVDIQATFPGNGDNSQSGNVTFDPARYKERPALLTTNTSVILMWSSHCDARPYTGWIMNYDERTLQQNSVLNIAPNGEGAAIWQSGAGPALDQTGHPFFLAANGTFDTQLNSSGFPSSGDYGNAFIRLNNENNILTVQDYFTMFNTVSESQADTDLGSGAAMLFPDLYNSSGTLKRLAVGAGKDTNIYVVDRSNLGRFHSDRNAVYQQLTGALPNGAWSAPAYFNGTMFWGGISDSIRAFKWTSGLFVAGTKTGVVFNYPGSTPSVSSNSSGGNAIVWALENLQPAVLLAFDATNLANQLYSSDSNRSRDQFGNGNKFVTPMIANGKVYAPSQTGVGVFGLLP